MDKSCPDCDDTGRVKTFPYWNGEVYPMEYDCPRCKRLGIEYPERLEIEIQMDGKVLK